MTGRLTMMKSSLLEQALWWGRAEAEDKGFAEEVEAAEAPAKVIVNARTGTVVINSAVRVGPAAVTHGKLTVRIDEDQRVTLKDIGPKKIEVIKEVLGIGESLSGNLLMYDALNTSFHKVKVKPDPECPLCGSHPSITDLSAHEAAS